MNGKWLKEPELLNFFAENDIKVDYNARGMMIWEEYQAVDMAAVVRRYRWWQIIIKCFNRFRSIW